MGRLARTYSFPIHNSSWLVSNAKVVTGVGRARRPGGGRGIRATCREGISSKVSAGSRIKLDLDPGFWSIRVMFFYFSSASSSSVSSSSVSSSSVSSSSVSSSSSPFSFLLSSSTNLVPISVHFHSLSSSTKILYWESSLYLAMRW